MRHYCKKCMAFGAERDTIEEVITNYITSMEPELKVAEDVYRQRLAQCEVCENLVNGMCRYCGCFCVIRALKKGQYCPHTEGNKWV